MGRMPDKHDVMKWGLLGVAAGGLAAGLLLLAAGFPGAARIVWSAGTLPVLAGLVLEIVQSLRRGDVGLDVVAALSMSAALIFDETLAAAVVALMYSGGSFLESYAEGRARHEMRALLERVPRSAMRHRDGTLEEVALDDVAPGDRLLVRRGDVVAVDGTVAGQGQAVLDLSALTGEALPQRFAPGEAVISGATNLGEAFDLVATHRAAESTYAGIVRLVEAAQRSKAPMARMADRYSVLFLLVTVAIAGAAWLLTGDPIRAVAVLVVATPCPLILAVPVALVAGVSRAARAGVLVKGARALEMMARVKTMILDKTGTLTEGRPRIATILPEEGFAQGDVLRLAAALDQGSKHPIAQSIVAEARTRGLTLPVPSDLREAPGEGVTGRIDGQEVVVGGLDFVARTLGHAPPPAAGITADQLGVGLGVGGRWAGRLMLADGLRTGTAGFLQSVRDQGVERIVLATGDRRAVAEAVTRDLGLDALHADLTPDQKVLTVLSARKDGPVMMVGDGVNDAPALAAADLGVAMGARGAAASAEAADVVLLVDHLDRILPGMVVARRSVAIARQSVVAGLGLSVLGMVAAAFGYLSPVQGAMLQEVIDVAVILNALRVLRVRPMPGEAQSAPPPEIAWG